MGSRERKRGARRKRKERRAGGRQASEASPPTGSGDPGAGNGKAGTRPSRSELKDRAAREALEPLRQGERPGAVTFGSATAALIAAIFWTSAVLAVATDIEVGGSQPNAGPLVLFAAVLTAMAIGMWRARYWAVLGFQALLALIMLSAALGLVQVDTLIQALGTVLILAGAGTLFYFMVKALARIQMPQRLPPD